MTQSSSETFVFSYGALNKSFGGATRVVLSRVEEFLKKGHRCIFLNCAIGWHFVDNVEYLKSKGYKIGEMEFIQLCDHLESKMYNPDENVDHPLFGCLDEINIACSGRIDVRVFNRFKDCIDIVVNYKNGIPYKVERVDTTSGKTVESYLFHRGKLRICINHRMPNYYSHFASNGFVFMTYFINDNKEEYDITLYNQSNKMQLKFKTRRDLVQYFIRDIVQTLLVLDFNNIYYFHDRISDPRYNIDIMHDRLCKIGILHGLMLARPVKGWHDTTFNKKLCGDYEGYCKYDAVVFLTKEQKDDFEKRFLPRNSNFVIPNYVTIPQNPLPFRERCPKTIVYVARFEYQKLPLDLIRAFQNVVSIVNDAKLLFYGAGYLEDDMRHLIKKLKLENNVRVVGYVDNGARVFEQAYLSVLPTEWEGHPLSLYESLVAGCPCVCYDFKYGLNDVLDYEKPCVFTIPVLYTDENAPGEQKTFFDIDKLSESIVFALQNPDVLNRMSKNAREYAIKYTKERHFKQWEDLISRINKQKDHRNHLNKMFVENTTADSDYIVTFKEASLSNIVHEKFYYRIYDSSNSGYKIVTTDYHQLDRLKYYVKKCSVKDGRMSLCFESCNTAFEFDLASL